MSRTFLFFLLLIGLFSCHPAPPTNQVCFDNQCIQVELAVNQDDWTKGLQHRATMPANSGMLFIFNENDRHSFWMKDTLIPLDMIWLDYARRIVYVASDVLPCFKDPCPSYQPPTQALYVLEVNSGTAARLNLRVGQIADFQLHFPPTPADKK